jgi:altronate hydrolase
LSETPEIYGAEHLLLRRARNREEGEKFVELIRWWEHYTAINDMEMDNNPAPGNKLGGLTTIYEKSLGALAKGGSTPLNAVYKYAEPITERGFVFMDTPGYDPVSVTGQVAGGSNIIVSPPTLHSTKTCRETWISMQVSFWMVSVHKRWASRSWTRSSPLLAASRARVRRKEWERRSSPPGY